MFSMWSVGGPQSCETVNADTNRSHTIYGFNTRRFNRLFRFRLAYGFERLEGTTLFTAWVVWRDVHFDGHNSKPSER